MSDARLLEILRALSLDDIQRLNLDAELYGDAYIHAARQRDGSMRARRIDPRHVRILDDDADTETRWPYYPWSRS